MKTIEQLMTEIEGHRIAAATDIELKPAGVRPSFEIAIREAKEGLVKATEEYSRRVFTSSVGFFVSGDKAKCQEFAAAAASVASVFVVDSHSMYDRMARDLEPLIGNSREVSTNHIPHINTSLRELAEKAGINETLAIRQGIEAVALATHEEVAAFVKSLVVGVLGESLNAAVMSAEIVEAALASKFTGTVLPVVILNANPGIRAALSGTFATKSEVAVDAETVIDEEFVLNVFRPGSKLKTEPKTDPKPTKTKK